MVPDSDGLLARERVSREVRGDSMSMESVP